MVKGAGELALIGHRGSTGEDENVLEMGGEVVAKWGQCGERAWNTH